MAQSSTSQTNRTPTVEIIRIYDDALIPVRAHPSDAGLDLFAYGTTSFGPGDAKPVPTGVKINIPSGVVGYVVPRSGRSLKRPFIQPNAPGTLDPGYQGEIAVPQLNLAEGLMQVSHAEKLAQLVFHDVRYFEPKLVSSFSSSTARGEKGFGSTDSEGAA